MQIFINDQAVLCPENSSISEILSQQDIQAVNIAVAINNTVISKVQWDKTIVPDGSRILIIKAVQGG